MAQIIGPDLVYTFAGENYSLDTVTLYDSGEMIDRWTVVDHPTWEDVFASIKEHP